MSSTQIPTQTAQIPTQTAPIGPKRADARRNYERILTAARKAFAEGGESTSLEEIARQAGVGIGTLYRHFPSRQVLLETLYVNEVHEVCRSASQREHDPWQALSVWCEGLIGYLITKRALAQELLNYLDEDASLFQECRRTVFAAGEPLLKRAQDVGVVRPDVEFADVLHMLAGISRMPASDPDQVTHVVRIALDGLRYRAQA
ncbi:MAG TPA: helix-turn-helix domain-containing protein [Solirubrobacteraceae bacterium]|jgi:AcrR family transcriptional regulator